MLGWRPSEFWAASIYEITTAILVHNRMTSPPPQRAMDDDEAWDFFKAVEKAAPLEASKADA